MLRSLFFATLFLACKGTTPSPQADFDQPTTTSVAPGQVDEVSGMVACKTQPDALWVQQDSGSPPELALLGTDGQVRGKITIPNAQNVDWEDMSSGPGPQQGVRYLYMGDIGDNNANRGECSIYRFPEPAGLNAAVGPVETIRFRYPDGARDAETLILDPRTRDLFILSKRDARGRLYRLAYPQSTTDVMTAEYLGELPFTFATGGAITEDGSEILIRNYSQIYYWKRADGQSLADAIQRTAGRMLPYRVEPQGEAITFDGQNRGYFTLSERAQSPSVNLFYYARK